MRTDETGAPCPETLGEYRDLCVAIGGEECAAVQLLDAHIARSSLGRDDKVIVPDSQMRQLLMPLLAPPKPASSEPASVAKGPHEVDATMSMWVVYEHPKDFPDCYVARRWQIERGNPEPVATPEILLDPALAPIRREMERRGLMRMEALPSDDPCILETWL